MQTSRSLGWLPHDPTVHERPAARAARTCPECGAGYVEGDAFCARDGAALGEGSAREAAGDPHLGQLLLGQFLVQARIGEGGMGTVYRARQLDVERDVAIKVLQPELARSPIAVQRFRREARVAVALDHPHVVRVILFAQLPDGSPCIVMEHLAGRSLAEVLRAEGRLSVERTVHVMTQIGAAIGAAHRQGIVHRDLKPSNVQLVRRGDDDDYVKVLDFGVARQLVGDPTLVTQAGLIFGTARYVSPEGARGDPTDLRSDVYSLGVLAYQLLCGETPFDGTNSFEILEQHVQRPAPDVRTRGGGSSVPRDVAAVLARALAKSPDARFADATAFTDALRAAQASAPAPLNETLAQAPSPFGDEADARSLVSIAGLPSTSLRLRKRRRTALALAVGVAIATAAVLLTSRAPTARPPHATHATHAAIATHAAPRLAEPASAAPVAVAPLASPVAPPTRSHAAPPRAAVRHRPLRRSLAPPVASDDGIDWTAPPPPP